MLYNRKYTLKEYNKIYKANNKEKIRGYYQKYKDKKKAYAVANKEKIQKYMKI